MSETEDFDKHIRNALEGHEFPFDEQNWEQASALIDADRKKKKRRAFFFWLILPGILAGASVWYALAGPTTATSTIAEQSSPGAAKDTPSAPQQVDQVKGLADNTFKGMPSTTAASKALSANPTGNQEAVVVTAAVKNTNTISSTGSAKRPRKPKKQAQVNDPVYVSQPAIKAPAAEEQTPVAIVAISSPEEAKMTSEPAQVAAADPVTATTDGAIPTAMATTADSLAPAAKDSASAAQTQKDSVLPEPIVKNRFTVLAGTAYLFAWEKEGGKPGNGFNPVAGVSYSRALGKRFSLNAGLQYLSVSNSRSKPMTINSTLYGFGETKEVITIDPKKLHYLTLPLRVSYPAHSKNTFSAGCNVGYLFYSVVETQQYTETPFMRSDINVTRSKGVFSGFNSFDLQVAIAYRRKIYKNWGVEAELFSGLSDIVNNNQFDAGAPQKNQGIKITLQYDLLKSKP
jgi:hypothetical protein